MTIAIIMLVKTVAALAGTIAVVFGFGSSAEATHIALGKTTSASAGFNFGATIV